MKASIHTRQIVLDTETTGIDPKQGHRIIEIGCVELLHREITGNTFQVYINPERDIEPGAKAVHGITEEMLIDKPKFAEIADAFLAFVEGAELIIHNAPFDVGHLNAELERLSVQYRSIDFYCPILDTLSMARQLHRGQKNNLDALCKRYNVNNTHREWHGALLDSELLAQVYLSMTGGQDSLFKDGPRKHQAHAISDVGSESWTLPVVQPTDAELAAHQAFIESELA